MQLAVDIHSGSKGAQIESAIRLQFVIAIITTEHLCYCLPQIQHQLYHPRIPELASKIISTGVAKRLGF